MSSSSAASGGAFRVLALALASLVPGGALAAQDEADRACGAFSGVSGSAEAECRLAVASARMIQPRLLAAMLGGNEVPGTASTLGMRIGAMPRMSGSVRVSVAPAELPPLLDRSRDSGERAVLLGFSADGAIAVLPGFSPLPTVGGVLSLDLIARAAFAPLPRDRGFSDGGIWGAGVGVRVGALRESFTLPGLSASFTLARTSRAGLGDPEGGSTDGYFRGPVTDLRAALSASKRLGLVGLTGGVALDRYRSSLDLGFRDGTAGPALTASGRAVYDRASAYLNAAWTALIFQTAAELGWQDSPLPVGIPAGVRLDPVGWYGGVAFRISI